MTNIHNKKKLILKGRAKGIEPLSSDPQTDILTIKLCSYKSVVGIEPTYPRIKIWRLTTWLYRKINIR